MSSKRFEGLTVAQTELLGRIACNDDTRVNLRMVKVLIAKGLVESYVQKDGPFFWTRYTVPVAVHIRWAQWCSTRTGDDE